jgi:hypothetical protein
VDNTRWLWGWLAVLVAVAVGGPFAMKGMFGASDQILPYVGVLLTVVLGFLGHILSRQQAMRLEREKQESAARLEIKEREATKRLARKERETAERLSIEAAMRAGELLAVHAGDPAAAASGLLALTKLDRNTLAVALLVDLWSPTHQRVPTETAILVVDAALRSTEPNARLLAAELLCRNSAGLDACSSMHWPSLLDGGWNPAFCPKTKLLLIEALLNMTLAAKANEGSLRSLAVRLYGIWQAEEHNAVVRGCLGMLIAEIWPRLRDLGFRNFIQGNAEIKIDKLEEAAQEAHANPDQYLRHVTEMYVRRLQVWASRKQKAEPEYGVLALAVVSRWPARVAP